jgi:hypothetical protein
MLDVMSMHLSTVETQVDIREEVVNMIGEHISELMLGDLGSCIIEVKFDAEDTEIELKFNWIIFTLMR